MVKHFKSCCCGCTLKTGTIIIATYELISSLGSLLRAGIDSAHSFNVDNTSNIEQVIYVLACIAFALAIIFSVMLIYAANNERPGLVKPWIGFEIAITLIMAVVCLGLFIIISLYDIPNSEYHIIVIVAVFIVLALKVYFILIVNSYHTELLQGMQYDYELGLQTKQEVNLNLDNRKQEI